MGVLKGLSERAPANAPDPGQIGCLLSSYFLSSAFLGTLLFFRIEQVPAIPLQDVPFDTFRAAG